MTVNEWRKVSALSYLNRTMANCWGQRNGDFHARNSVKSAIRYYRIIYHEMRA